MSKVVSETPSGVFDPESPMLVINGTLALAFLATGSIGAVTGAAIGVAQSTYPIVPGFHMALNGSIFGFTFFSVREYLVSPLLITGLSSSWPTYALRRYELDPSADVPDLSDKDPISLVRNDRLLDSGLAGAVTSGLASSVFRGVATIPRAAFTGTIITTSLQYASNNIKSARLSLLSSRSRTRSPATSDAPKTTLNTRPDLQDEAKGGAFTSSRSAELEDLHHQRDLTDIDGKPRKNFSEKVMDFFTHISPVRKISDEEYLTILSRQKGELEAEMQAAMQRFEAEGMKGGAGKEEGGDSGWWSGLGGQLGRGDKRLGIGLGAMREELEGIEKKMRGLQSGLERGRRV